MSEKNTAENKKKKEWVTMNRALLEASQISGFIHTTKEIGNESPMEMFRNALMPSCQSFLDEFLLFCGNVFRVHGVAELDKLVNPNQDSITLFSFMNDNYLDKAGKEHAKFGNWKKTTKATREKLRSTRNEFTSHLDKTSFHSDKFFGLYIEDVDKLVSETFGLFDFLYETDNFLEKSFNQEINPGLHQKPSQVAQSWKNIMATRIEYLKKCCKNSRI